MVEIHRKVTFNFTFCKIKKKKRKYIYYRKLQDRQLIHNASITAATITNTIDFNLRALVCFQGIDRWIVSERCNQNIKTVWRIYKWLVIFSAIGMVIVQKFV